MPLLDQDSKNENSLIKDLIADEISYGAEDSPVQESAESGEQTEEVKAPAKPQPKAPVPKTPEPKAEDQAPKKTEYRLKGKSDLKPQPAEKPEEEESAEPSEQEPVMTAEFVRMNGLPKNMVGLPYSELGRSYKNIVSEYTRTRQKFAEFERGHGSESEKPPQVATNPVEQAPKTQVESLEESVQERLSKLPDPLDEGYTQSLTKTITDIAKDIQAAVRTEYKQSFEAEIAKLRPQVDSAHEFARRQAQKELTSEIQRQLPEGADLQDVLKAFKEEYADDLQDLMPLYEKKPQRFVKDIVNFFHLNYELVDATEETAGGGETEELRQRQLNAMAQRKAAEALKESRKKKASDLNSHEHKSTPKRSELMTDLLADEEAIFNQMNPQDLYPGE